MGFTKEELRKDINKAYIFLRENNNSIPSDSLEYMRDKAIEGLERDFIEKKKEKKGEDYILIRVDAFCIKCKGKGHIEIKDVLFTCPDCGGHGVTNVLG